MSPDDGLGLSTRAKAALVACAVTGPLIAWLLGREWLAVPLATDWLHGAWPVLAAVLILGFALASPRRARTPAAALVHGAALTLVLGVASFLMFFADLWDRNDRLLQLLLALGVASGVAQWAGPWAVGRWTYRSLCRDPGGGVPLRYARRLLDAPPDTTASPAPVGWWGRAWERWLLRPGLWLRRWLGLGPSRSYAMEGAFEGSLARASAALLQALGGQCPPEALSAQANRTLRLLIAVLRLRAVVAEHGGPPSDPEWRSALLNWFREVWSAGWIGLRGVLAARFPGRRGRAASYRRDSRVPPWRVLLAGGWRSALGWLPARLGQALGAAWTWVCSAWAAGIAAPPATGPESRDLAWLESWMEVWVLLGDARDRKVVIDPELLLRLGEATQTLIGADHPALTELLRDLRPPASEPSESEDWTARGVWLACARPSEAWDKEEQAPQVNLDQFVVLLYAERCIAWGLGQVALDLLETSLDGRLRPWLCQALAPALAQARRRALGQVAPPGTPALDPVYLLLARGDERRLVPWLKRRSTAALLAFYQGPWDPGPARFAASLALTALVAVVVLGLSAPPPWGAVHKPLNDLYRVARYDDNRKPLTAWGRFGRELILASNGGGLHRVDTRTFRIRTERPRDQGISSPFLTDLAVADNGNLAVVTGSSADPSAEPDGGGAHGLDLRLPSGAWHTLIGAHGVPSPRAADLRLLGKLGEDKVLVMEGRLLRYDASERALKALTPPLDLWHRIVGADTGAAPLSGLTAVAQSVDDPHDFWVATRKTEGQGSAVTALWRLSVGDAGHFDYTAVPHPLPPQAEVDQLAAGAGWLWVKTKQGALYQRQGDDWTYRMDGDTGLDLKRVRHVVLAPDAPPALWLTELEPARGVVGLRMRPLGGLVNQGDPWRRLNLTDGDLAGSLALDADAVPPLGWFEPRDRTQRLLIARRGSGLERFTVSAGPIERPAQAVIAHERIALADQHVLSMDRMGDRLVLVTEPSGSAGDQGTERRVIIAALADLDRIDAAVRAPLQQAAVPDEEQLRKTRPLAAGRQPDQDGGELVLVTDDGRVLVYDAVRHGLTSRAGARLALADKGTVGRLVGASVRVGGPEKGGLISVLDDGGRVIEVTLPPRVGTAPLTGEVRHAAADMPLPASDLEPLRVATGPAGVEIFFGAPDQGEQALVEPWQLLLSEIPRKRGLLSVLEPVASVPEPVAAPDQPKVPLRLRLNSLTRLFEGTSPGPLLAIDADGVLRWRSAGAWEAVPDTKSKSGWQSLFPLVGGTFALREGTGLWQVRLGDGPAPRPTLPEPPWWRESLAGLTLPVTGAVGLAGGGVLVAHAGGLSQYDPQKRTWDRISELRPAGDWQLLCPADQDGRCPAVWALGGQTGAAGAAPVLRVRPDGQDPIDRPGQRMAAVGAGTALALRYDDGRVEVQRPADARVDRVDLLAAGNPGIGDAALTSAVPREGIGQLLAVDAHQRVLAAPFQRLGLSPRGEAVKPVWRVYRQDDPGQPVVGLAADADGALVYRSKDGALFVEAPAKTADQAAGDLQPLNWPATEVQRVGGRVVAANADAGLGVLNQGHNAIVMIAGGRDPKVDLGSGINAVLADGNSLYLAGQSGAAFRDPKQRRTLAIPNSADLDRFEALGRHLIAWRGVQSLRIDGAKAPIPLAAPPLLGPAGALWLQDQDGLRPEQETRAGCSPPRLLCYEGRFDPGLTHLARLDNDRLLARGEGGDLFYYDLRKRSLRRLKTAAELGGASWHFASYAWGTFVVPDPGDTARPIGEVLVNDEPGWKQVVGDARWVLAHAKGLAWIDGQDQATFVTGSGTLWFSPSVTS